MTAADMDDVTAMSGWRGSIAKHVRYPAMTVGPHHRTRSWCLLGIILLSFAALVAVGIYAVSNSAETPRGSQGPMMERAPSTDTPTAS
jgi:hypothetical protein